VTVTRGQRTLTFPALTMLVGACNACPCARGADSCVCTEVDRIRYARRPGTASKPPRTRFHVTQPADRWIRA
jgi:predicted ATPase with chaperone activity